jgi:hypothetical protein
LFYFIKRFATASYASTHQRVMPASLTASTLDFLARDAFGFRQVIIAANDLGKIYGLDSSSGAVLWSRTLGLGWAAQVGGQIIPRKLFVVGTVAEGGSPEAVLVAQRRANNVQLLPSCFSEGTTNLVSGIDRYSGIPCQHPHWRGCFGQVVGWYGSTGN